MLKFLWPVAFHLGTQISYVALTSQFQKNFEIIKYEIAKSLNVETSASGDKYVRYL